MNRIALAGSSFFFWSFPLSGTEPRRENEVVFEIAVSQESELGKETIKALTEVFKTHGYVFKAEAYPPMRGIEELKKGKVDGSVGRHGNLLELYGIKGFFRLDVPFLFLTVAMWCNKPLTGLKDKSITVGYKRGSVATTRLIDLIENASVSTFAATSYRIAISMLKVGRLECILGSDAILESDGNSLAELAPYSRHNLMTTSVYPWASNRFSHLKDKLQNDLAQYAVSAKWTKKFLKERARCKDQYDYLCPDGIVFKRETDMTQMKNNPVPAAR